MKTIYLALLGLALVPICGTPPTRAGDTDDLWPAVYALGDQAKSAPAEATLRAGGRPAILLLVHIARLPGDSLALKWMASAWGCWPVFGDGFQSFTTGNTLRYKRAGELAGELLGADAELAESWRASPDVFLRRAGYVALLADPPRLAQEAKNMTAETEPAVVEAVAGLARCLLRKSSNVELGEAVEVLDALEQRRSEMLPPRRCDAPGFAAGPILDGLLDGRHRVVGWARSNNDLTITVAMADGTRSALTPACALGLYDAAVRTERFLPELLVTLVEERTLAPADREAALKRVERDFPRWEVDAKTTARLVNGGAKLRAKIPFNAEDPFAQEDLLEAAARLGDESARAAIEKAFFCRGGFSDSDRIALMGFVPGSADLAAEIARRCPDARAAATAALIRLGDPRAVRTLGDSVNDPRFAREVLERALFDAPTPALLAELRRLAARDDIKGIHSRLMLERLEAAGLAPAEH